MADNDVTTLSDTQVQAACDLLRSHWQRGTRLAALPADLRPGTREDGYRIQARLEHTSAGPRMGWKIAATSAAGQAHIAVDGPLAGRLLRDRVRESGARVPFGTNHMRVAEAEFAFRFGTDLPARAGGYDAAAVLDAITSLHPAIEIPDSRFDDFTRAGAPQLIADNACAHWFVLGPPAPSDWRGIDLVTHLATGRVTGRVEREGCGANVLGDPREALMWLVNELSRLGVTLHAGEVVTTGTCLVPLPIEAGDHVVADFGPLGQVEARVED